MLALVAVAIGAVAAYTAAIGIGGTVQAGAGITTPPTPSITQMYFTYDQNTPTYMQSVTVTFSSSVSFAKAQLAGSWSNDCTGSGSGPWTCSWSTEPSVSSIASNRTLRVIAS